MRKDKSIVFEMRKQGKSYRDIQKEIGVSRSTLTEWFKNELWSKHIQIINKSKNLSLSKDRILMLNKARNKKLALLYTRAEEEASIEFNLFKSEPLFMAGLMIYAGEGDKVNKNLIRISNCEFFIHKYFISFVEKYLNFKRENIKCALVIYPDHNIADCMEKWSFELKISLSNFHKTQIIKGKEKIKRLQYGTGMIIISNTFLKKKLMKWIELSKVQIDAGLV